MGRQRSLGGEGAGGPTGGRLNPDNDKSDKAGNTKPIMEDETEALELKYAKLPPIALSQANWPYLRSWALNA
jgi:hypothetical protein